MKKTIFIIIALLLISSVVGIYFYIKTPSYTFKQISKAVETHDWNLFNKYVDLDSLYTNTITDSELTGIASGIEAMSRQNLKRSFIDNIKKAVEGTSDEQDESLLYVFPILVDKNDNYKINSMRKHIEGKLIIVKIPVKMRFNFYTEVSYKFRKETFKSKLIDYDDKEKRELNSELYDLISDYYALPLKEKMEKAVSINILKKYKGCSKWSGDFCMQDILMMPTKITNNTDKDIKELIYYVYPNDLQLQLDKYGRYESAENIKANKSETIGENIGRKYNDFDTEDKLFMDTDKKDICFKIDKIEFTDGEILEKKYAFQNIDKFTKEYPDPTYETFLKIINIREKYGLNDSESLKAKYEAFR